MENINKSNNPPYEWYANKRKEFAEKYSIPLESIVLGINIQGLIKKHTEEQGSYYESNYIESVVESERRGAGIYAKTPYADTIVSCQREKETATFLEKIKNTVVLDLGSGDGQDPYGYILAEALGAKRYIGVDKFNDPLFEYFSVQEAKKRFDISLNDIPFAVVREDLLDFLHRVPDNSVSIFTSAITAQISIGRRYVKDVEKEISRVLDPNGAYIAYFSDFEPKGLIRNKSDKLTSLGGLLKFTKPK